MKTMQQWFDEYGDSHQNVFNEIIHSICVPVIFLTIVGLLSLIPFPSFSQNSTALAEFLHFGTLLLLIGMIFYIRLSLTMSAGILIVSLLVLFLVKIINIYFAQHAWIVYLLAFAAAWVGQFIGHSIEGKKPSFFKDLQFLMVGPGWLLSHIYQRLGIKL
jgi:uncharacterized membrane protein YGL010W